MTLAPFHSWNLLPLVALRWHDVEILVEFHDADVPYSAAVVAETVDLCGNVYFVGASARRRLVDERLEFGIAQCQ